MSTFPPWRHKVPFVWLGATHSLVNIQRERRVTAQKLGSPLKACWGKLRSGGGLRVKVGEGVGRLSCTCTWQQISLVWILMWWLRSLLFVIDRGTIFFFFLRLRMKLAWIFNDISLFWTNSWLILKCPFFHRQDELRWKMDSADACCAS